MRNSVAPVILATLAFVTPLHAQVRIEIPSRQYTTGERITAAVVNSTSRTIAYCTGIETFGWSKNGKVVSDLTISPFGVLHKSQAGKWGILLDGVDVRNSWRIDSLEPGHSQQYSFKVREKGEKRLVIEYKFDDGANCDCSDPYGRWKKTRSRTFLVR